MHVHSHKRAHTRELLTMPTPGQRGLDDDVVLELVAEPLAGGAEGEQIAERGEGEDVDEPNLEGQSVGLLLLLLRLNNLPDLRANRTCGTDASDRAHGGRSTTTGGTGGSRIPHLAPRTRTCGPLVCFWREQQRFE